MMDNQGGHNPNRRRGGEAQMFTTGATKSRAGNAHSYCTLGRFASVSQKK